MNSDHCSISRRTFLAGSLALVASAPGFSGQGATPAHKDEDLHYFGLTEIAGRLRRRELSPVDATKAQLARIGALDT